MKKLILIGTLALGGCGLFPSAGTDLNTALNDAKIADTAAHQLHGFAADMLGTAAQLKALHGAAATTAKTLLNQSESYLQKADSYIQEGDAVNATAQIVLGNNASIQVESIATGAPK